MPPPSILLLGHGELGASILEALQTHTSVSTPKAKPPITLATRKRPSPSLVKILNSHSVSHQLLDITTSSLSQLSTFFRNFDTLISATGMALPPGSQRKLAEAAIIASEPNSSGQRLKTYLPWQYGVDYDVIGHTDGAMPLFDEQLSVRQLLRSQSNLDWVVVSVGMFTEFLFSLSFGVIGDGIVHPLGTPGTLLTITSTTDVGKAVAEAALVPPRKGENGFDHGVVKVAGDTLSYEGIATVLGRWQGRKWVCEEMDRSLLGDDMMGRYRKIFGNGKGVAWEREGSWGEQRNLQLQGLEDWVAVTWGKEDEG